MNRAKPFDLKAIHPTRTPPAAVPSKRLDDEQRDRLARIGPTTLSVPELELIEHYRAARPDLRAAFLTIMRTHAPERSAEYHWKCDEPAVTKKGGA